MLIFVGKYEDRNTGLYLWRKMTNRKFSNWSFKRRLFRVLRRESTSPNPLFVFPQGVFPGKVWIFTFSGERCQQVGETWIYGYGLSIYGYGLSICGCGLWTCWCALFYFWS